MKTGVQTKTWFERCRKNTKQSALSRETYWNWEGRKNAFWGSKETEKDQSKKRSCDGEVLEEGTEADGDAEQDDDDDGDNISAVCSAHSGE